MAGVALALLIGFRHEVGGDWFTYMEHYDFMVGAPLQEVLEKGDPGYYLLVWLSTHVNGGVYLVNLVSGALFSAGLVAFCRIQPRPWLALSVAMPYMVIVVGMGYSRQGLALGLAMLGLVGLARKSNLQFVLCVALAATFHKSAVLLVPLAVLSTPHGKLWTGLWVGITAAVLYYVLLADSVEGLVKNYVEAEYQSEGAAVRLAMNAVPAAALAAVAQALCAHGAGPQPVDHALADGAGRAGGAGAVAVVHGGGPRGALHDSAAAVCVLAPARCAGRRPEGAFLGRCHRDVLRAGAVCLAVLRHPFAVLAAVPVLLASGLMGVRSQLISNEIGTNPAWNGHCLLWSLIENFHFTIKPWRSTRMKSFKVNLLGIA